MLQTKEQDKTPKQHLSEVEIGNLPNKEFRVMIIKMIQELGKRMDTQSKNLQEVFNRVRKYKEQANRVEEYNN